MRDKTIHLDDRENVVEILTPDKIKEVRHRVDKNGSQNR